MSEVNFVCFCKPFTSLPRGRYRVLVDLETGLVHVWDSLAGHYTLCHALSPALQRHIRREADRLAAV
jgi:hypothetical protein